MIKTNLTKEEKKSLRQLQKAYKRRMRLDEQYLLQGNVNAHYWEMLQKTMKKHIRDAAVVFKGGDLAKCISAGAPVSFFEPFKENLSGSVLNLSEIQNIDPFDIEILFTLYSSYDVKLQNIGDFIFRLIKNESVETARRLYKFALDYNFDIEFNNALISDYKLIGTCLDFNEKPENKILKSFMRYAFQHCHVEAVNFLLEKNSKGIDFENCVDEALQYYDQETVLDFIFGLNLAEEYKNKLRNDVETSDFKTEERIDHDHSRRAFELLMSSIKKDQLTAEAISDLKDNFSYFKQLPKNYADFYEKEAIKGFIRGAMGQDGFSDVLSPMLYLLGVYDISETISFAIDGKDLKSLGAILDVQSLEDELYQNNVIYSLRLGSEYIDYAKILISKVQDFEGCDEEIYELLSSLEDVDILKSMIEKGLDVRFYSKAVLQDLHEALGLNHPMTLYVQEHYGEKLENDYPYWEKVDADTIAEVSYRAKAQGQNVLLHRAFNFRAGVVDTSYQYENRGKIEKIELGSSVPMQSLDQEFCQKAALALKDENGTDYTQRFGVVYKKNVVRPPQSK